MVRWRDKRHSGQRRVITRADIGVGRDEERCADATLCHAEDLARLHSGQTAKYPDTEDEARTMVGKKGTALER